MSAMRFPISAIGLFAILAAAFVATIGTAAADDYPTRPILLVVPYPAGGGNDVLARMVAAKMSVTLGQQIVIENRGGAGSTIGTRDVARERARRLHASDRDQFARDQSAALSGHRL